MAPMLAVSLRSLVQDVGAYAGIAAIFGLAVLALLYFAQAREVKRLRDWAGRSPERAQELEQRVTAQAEASGRAAQAPVRQPPATAGATPYAAAPPGARVGAAAAGATAAAVAAGRAAAPHAPSGAELTTVQRPGGPAAAPGTRPEPVNAAPRLGAPALGSATPAPALLMAAGGSAAAPEAPAPAAAPDPPVASDAEPVSPPEAAPAPQRARPAASTAAASTRVVPPPAAAPSGGNGRRDAPLSEPGRRTVAIGSRPEERLLPDDATIPPRRAAAGRPPGDGRARRRSILLIGAGLLLAAAVAFAVVQLTSGSNEGGGTAPAAKAKVKQGGGQGSSFSRGAVTVAVLNGTPTAGLANQVATELVRRGFGRGAVTNAQNQQRSATVVAYLPGHRRDATEVARALRIPAAVEPVDPDTRAVACPPPAPCKANVVVTVGSDRTG